MTPKREPKRQWFMSNYSWMFVLYKYRYIYIKNGSLNFLLDSRLWVMTSKNRASVHCTAQSAVNLDRVNHRLQIDTEMNVLKWTTKKVRQLEHSAWHFIQKNCHPPPPPSRPRQNHRNEYCRIELLKILTKYLENFFSSNRSLWLPIP